MMMTTLMPKSKIRALQIAKEMLSKIISMKEILIDLIF